MRRALITLVLLVAVGGTALAAGAPLATAPPVLHIPLGMPLEQALASGTVVGPHGARASLARVDPDDPDAIVLVVPSDGAGTYRAAWSVLSTDGHPIAGTRALVVRSAEPVAPAIAPRGSDGVGLVGIIARLLVLLGVLGTLGMAVTREWVLGTALRQGGIAPPGDVDADGRRARAALAADAPVRAWWRAWWALEIAWLVGLAMALPAQAARLGIGTAGLGTLLGDTRWGTAWIGLAILAGIAAAAGVIVRRGDASPSPGATRARALAAPGAVGAIVLSWSGHASTGTDATLGTILDVLHGWATAVWLGGILMLAVLAIPLLRALAPDDRVRLGAGIVVRFSAVAMAAVVVLVVTGVYRALAELPSPSALWTTAYGAALIVKLAIFAVMLAVAVWNRWVLHPRLERAALGIAPGDTASLGALRISMRAELVLALAVLAAVAVLVSVPPPV